jgi:sulfite exporter TauE/SafE
MCGGIAGSLGALSGASNRGLTVPALQFNLGRLLGYAVLGALAGGILGAAGEIMALKPLGRWLRGLTALLVLLIGLRFLFDWRGLDVIEKGGASLWRRILPLAVRISQRHDWIGRTGLGVCWGFLPCGLVYTVLVTAASTASAPAGAVTMLAFGAGTLPAMLGLTMVAPALHVFLGDRFVRRIVGFSLVVLAAWMFMTLFMAMSAAHSSGLHH